jgi:nucleoid DNA-binding protein
VCLAVAHGVGRRFPEAARLHQARDGPAKLAVEATIEEITAQLAAGNEVKFTGFGKFSRRSPGRLG